MRIPLTHQLNNYSQRLTGDFLRLYNECVENLSRGILTTRISFSDTSVDMQEVFTLVSEAIVYGCPELFYISQQIGMSYSTNEVTLTFTNKYEGQNLSKLWEALDNEINRIVDIINALPNPYRKLNRLNKYLCMRVKYNASADDKYSDAYGALISKEARCEGYAKAAKLILDRLGFNSIIACGDGIIEGSRVSHTWNIIEYKSNYYHFDFTWNASNTRYGIPGQIYMFLDDETAHIEHLPRYSYPACLNPTKTFWALNNGVIKYHSDLARIKIIAFNNNYLAMAKMPRKLTQFELDDEIFTWMQDELAGYNYGSQLSYSYNDRINILVFYFIN